MAKGLGSLLQPHQKHRASCGTSYGLGGLREEEPPVMMAHPPFGLPTLWGVGEQQALFGASPQVEGANCLSILGEGAPEGGEADSLVLWPPATMRSTSQLTEVPTKAISSSWSPFSPRCAAALFISTTFPQLPQHLQIMKREEVNRCPKEEGRQDIRHSIRKHLNRLF